jgi:uncharacterized protein YndB with AHSA1/START domain
MLMEASDVALEVRSSVTVQLPREEAFRLFTDGIGRWWPLARFSVYEADATNVTMEPRLGGRLYESAADGRTSDWGTVTVWDPVDRVAMTWHPGYGEELSTVVEVTFSDAPDGGTQVDLLHTGWEVHGAEAEDAAATYRGGWSGVLELFARAAN